MGHALRKQELQIQDFPAERVDLAQYAADMLASLSRLSQENGMPFLAHLTELARLEAIRNRTPEQADAAASD
jgi:hypothetical protein